MTSPRSYSKPPANPAHGTGDAYPVLVRIPDVGDLVQKSSSTQKVGDGPLAYRFDPPQSARRASTIPTSRYSETTSGVGISSVSSETPKRISRAVTNQAYERFDRPNTHPRTAERSPILPSTDPFEIPARGLTSALAPAMRFAMLVALFTAAGTSILMMRNSDSSAREANQAKPNSLVKHATITPARTEPGVTLPTAVGPLGSAAQQKRIEATKPKSRRSPPFSMTTLDTKYEESGQSVTPTGKSEGPSTDDFTGAETGCVYPVTGFPSAALSPMGSLPQVRTTQEAPAMARFSGTVIEAAPRQAQHDDESSLH